MKKILSALLAACLLSIAGQTYAQDSRKRNTETIVQDVLALMPFQQQADFDREMADLAKTAPTSVELLCQMLQPAEKHANNKVEYAISGVVNYVAAHPEYKTQVLRALKLCAPRAADVTARQFINDQARLLDDDADPVVYTEHAGTAPYAAQWEALKKGGEATILAAVKSKDHAYRMQALKYATDNNLVTDELCAKVAKLYKKADVETKEDILSWLGDNKVKSQEALLAQAAKGEGVTAKAAIEALGKLGTQEAAASLLACLGTANNDAAMSALRSFPANISGRVNEALKTAQGARQDALCELAYARRIRACGSQILSLATTSDAALKALPGVVIKSDAPAVAKLIDAADAAKQPHLQKALAACYERESVANQYAAISKLMKQSGKPENYYGILAATGTDESVAELQDIYTKTESQAALNALKQSKNYKATKALWMAAKKGDETAVDCYARLVNANVKDADDKVTLLSQALNQAKATATKKNILGYLGNIATLPAFTTVSNCLKEKELAYTAAYACKNIAGKAAGDIDYKHLQEALTQSSEIIKANGTADDGYAVDEIKKILNEAKPVPPTELSAEEKKEGFELLFDGTNLDKWQGNKVGYVPVNGTIFVTANYGNDGNLYTTKEYKDFVFRFEFCFVRPGINNGVGIRTPMNVDAAYDAMCECQILDHDDPIYAGLRDYQVHGSVYGVIPAKRIKHKPLGEWSTEEIRVKGNHITVTVNGEVIVDGDVKQACKGHNMSPDGSDTNPYTVDHKNHPGMFNKKGYISFCGHGPGLKLRNIRVKELK